jgi:hypothetical protein
VAGKCAGRGARRAHRAPHAPCAARTVHRARMCAARAAHRARRAPGTPHAGRAACRAGGRGGCLAARAAEQQVLASHKGLRQARWCARDRAPAPLCCYRSPPGKRGSYTQPDAGICSLTDFLSLLFVAHLGFEPLQGEFLGS